MDRTSGQPELVPQQFFEIPTSDLLQLFISPPYMYVLLKSSSFVPLQ
jgi:hypothetical protein